MDFHEIESYEEMPHFEPIRCKPSSSGGAPRNPRQPAATSRPRTEMDIAADRLEVGGLKFLPGQSFGEMRFNACRGLNLPAEAQDIIDSHHMDKLQYAAETALAGAKAVKPQVE